MLTQITLLLRLIIVDAADIPSIHMLSHALAYNYSPLRAFIV